MNPPKQIETVEDFNNYCDDALTYFCESLEGDIRYTRPLTENEKESYPTTEYFYTHKGSAMIDRYTSRLYNLSVKLFGDDPDIDIKTHMFQDLDD